MQVGLFLHNVVFHHVLRPESGKWVAGYTWYIGSRTMWQPVPTVAFSGHASHFVRHWQESIAGRKVIGRRYPLTCVDSSRGRN